MLATKSNLNAAMQYTLSFINFRHEQRGNEVLLDGYGIEAPWLMSEDDGDVVGVRANDDDDHCTQLLKVQPERHHEHAYGVHWES